MREAMDEVSCSTCSESLDGPAITDNLFLSGDGGRQHLMEIGPSGHVHMHGVVVMPLGQERLWPTARRTVHGVYLRGRFQVRRLLRLSAVFIRGNRLTHTR